MPDSYPLPNGALGDAPSTDLEQPLLTASQSDELEVQVVDKGDAADSSAFVGELGGVLNLTNAIIGAGLLAVPRGLATLGVWLSLGSMIAVVVLMVATIHVGMTGPSITAGSVGTLLFTSYSASVNAWVGPNAERVFSVVMMAGLLGFEASYLDIIADVLLGNQDSLGLLSSYIGRLCGCDLPGGPTGEAADGDSAGLHPPEWASTIVDRRLVLSGVLAGILLPLAMRRNIGALSAVNALGIVALTGFLITLLVLAVAAVAQGKAHALPMGPNIAALGTGSTVQVLTAFNILSILLTANSCHVNMHPLMRVVKPISRASVKRITVISISIAAVKYCVATICAYIVFGDDIQGDVLLNLNPEAMTPLVGPWAAAIMAFVVRTGYLISIIGSSVLVMFPLRQVVTDLILGSAAASAPTPLKPALPVAVEAAPEGGDGAAPLLSKASGGADAAKPDARDALHVPLTLGLYALAYLLAVTIPSIWIVVSLVGSCSATVLSFIMPALIGLQFLRKQRPSPRGLWLIRLTMHVAVLMGVLIFVNGFVNLYWTLRSGV